MILPDFNDRHDHPQIQRDDVKRFMSWELTEDMDLYVRIVDAIISEPEGQVAHWCDEIRKIHQKQHDKILDHLLSSEDDELDRPV